MFKKTIKIIYKKMYKKKKSLDHNMRDHWMLQN